MEGEEGAGETPDVFLGVLGDNLTKKEGIDVGLADIMKTHILKAAPAQDAVAQAKAAILKLAAERANPPKPEAADG